MNVKRTSVWVAAAMVVSTCATADEPADRVVRALLKAHNRERRLKELAPLTLSSSLCAAALIHARDMAGHQMISHTGTDGSAPADRIKRVGYLPRRTGENCAEGQWTVGEVMSGWMKSTGHRANILANFTEMGAAWAQDDEGTIYWCIDFGTPRFVAPKAPRRPEEAAAAVVKQINRERQLGRMVLLDTDLALTRAAMARSASMAAKDRPATDGDPANRLDEAASHGRDVFLRVCASAVTPEQAARELHRGDVEQLHSFREIGVGYAVARSGKGYWCAFFVRPSDRESTIDSE